MVGLADRYINTFPMKWTGSLAEGGRCPSFGSEPQIYCCDSGFRPGCSIQAQILNLLMDLQDGGSDLYVYYHDLSVVKHISDEIGVMYLGQCVERANSKELFANPLHPYTKALLSAIPVPRLRKDVRHQIIRGELSDPIEPEPGCRFANRCDFCQ